MSRRGLCKNAFECYNNAVRVLKNIMWIHAYKRKQINFKQGMGVIMFFLGRTALIFWPMLLSVPVSPSGLDD